MVAYSISLSCSLLSFNYQVRLLFKICDRWFLYYSHIVNRVTIIITTEIFDGSIKFSSIALIACLKN